MKYVIGLVIVGALWYALSRLGTHYTFRTQKKRWPLKLPFTPIHTGNVVGVYLPAKPGKETLLFFHGRGGNVSHFEKFAQVYAPLGYGILMFDYRGFGLSRGRPSQKHLQEDSKAMLTYALDILRIPARQLVLFGHSLGNAGALFAACTANQTPKALILQSPFLTAPEMAASWGTGTYQPQRTKYRLIRAFVTPFLWFNRFDNVPLARQIKIPTLVCYSKQDRTLPWQQSAKLADYITPVRRFLAQDGGHDEFDWAQKEVVKFLAGH